MSSRRWPNWLRGSLEPDEIIGAHGMKRWWIVKSRWFSIYVHHSTADDERLLHDHPAWNVSIRLRGQLREQVPGVVPLFLRDSPKVRLQPTRAGGWILFINGRPDVRGRPMPRVVFRRATDIHRLVVPDKARGCWTLWIRGRARGREDDWGFYTPEFGWVPWRQGVAYMRAQETPRE